MFWEKIATYFTRSQSVPRLTDKEVKRTLSEEFEEIRKEAQKLLPEDRISCMMPKVEEEILETIVSNYVRWVFDPLAQQLTDFYFENRGIKWKTPLGRKAGRK